MYVYINICIYTQESQVNQIIPARDPKQCGGVKGYCTIIEGSLEVKLPTIWTDGKAEVGRVREEKRSIEKMREEKESEDRRCRCTKR